MRPNQSWFKGITRNVVVLGFVSFFTDVSSEMIYPLLPLFMTSVLGAGAAFLGIVEGLAESAASLLKLVSGVWSDRVHDRARLILAGYGLSAFSRPCVAAATHPLMVLFVRVFDRIGKGIRTSPRDAILADSVEASVRGKAYGFHRSMDHAGAVFGPLIAAGLLASGIVSLRGLFWLAAIPGALAVILIISAVREVRQQKPRAASQAPPLTLPRGSLRAYLLILFLFTLGNSSDAFLLLRASQLGVAAAAVPLLWVFFHVVKMVSVFPFGMLSDRFGRRRMILGGWVIYAVTYAGFAKASTAFHIWALFCLYGLFYGMTEGVERALMADLAVPQERGAVFGWYNAVIGAGALPASALFGAVWQRISPAAAFQMGAGIALVSAVLLLVVVRPRKTVSR